ncbi:MAG: type II toxin-antitoxin system MqsA family antitoxin [Oscillospiraceae bacterium]|nr:type II toxin-antitoxin system MqsA family antitoxin [Oscillospiraceae bacterium]
MNCNVCRGSIINKNSSFMVDVDDRYYIVKNVPSRVCRQCGNTSYNNEVAERLEEILDEMESSGEEVTITEYSKKNEINKNFVEDSESIYKFSQIEVIQQNISLN